jgi:hypothetical protein
MSPSWGFELNGSPVAPSPLPVMEKLVRLKRALRRDCGPLGSER